MPTSLPALEALRERLVLNGITRDHRRIATAILGLAYQNNWTQDTEHMVEWLEQLAMDVASASDDGKT